MACDRLYSKRIVFVFFLLFTLMTPFTARASNYSSSTLDSILAPIALYPDSLLGDVLAAATYPDQLIEADAWAAQHGYKDATSTLDSVKSKSWDDSVKALLLTPDVIAMMVNDLTWTDKLAQAFTTQQSALCDSVQRLRRQAKENGALESTSQVKIIDQDGVISIGSAQSDIIVVPQYSTTVCTQKLDPATTVLNTALVWGTVRTLDAIFFGSYWDWHSHDVYIGPGYNHYYWHGAPRPWYPAPPPPPPGRPDPRHPAHPYKPAFHPSHNPPPPGYITHQKHFQNRRPGHISTPITDKYHHSPHDKGPAVTPPPNGSPHKVKGNQHYQTPERHAQEVHSQQNIKRPDSKRPALEKRPQTEPHVQPRQSQHSNRERIVRSQPDNSKHLNPKPHNNKERKNRSSRRRR